MHAPRRSSGCATRRRWAPPCARPASPTRRRSAPPTHRDGPSAPAAGCASRCAAAADGAFASGAAATLDGEVVVQEHISGLACSAAAVADGRSAVLLGVSEQLIGHRGLGARGYAWCGNLVPPRLGEVERTRAGRSGAGDMHASGVGIRTARAVRRGPRVGRRARLGRRGQPPSDGVARMHRGGARGRRLLRPPGRLRRAPALDRSRCQPAPRRPARRFCSPPATCASATPAAGRRAASATCPTRMSGSPPAIRSAPSSRCRSPRRRFSPTSRRVPPRSASSSVSAPGSVRSPDGPMLRPDRDALAQRSRSGARRPPRRRRRSPARGGDHVAERHAADRLRQRGPRRTRGGTALRGDLHGRPGHGVVRAPRARRAAGFPGSRSSPIGRRWPASRRSTRAGAWTPRTTSRWPADRAGR